MKKFWILAVALTFLSIPAFSAPPGGHGSHHGGGMRAGGPHTSMHSHAARPIANRPIGRPSAGRPPVGRPPVGRPLPPRYVHHRPMPPLIITGGYYRPYYRPYYYYDSYYYPPYYYPYGSPYYYDEINTTANIINAAASAATAIRVWTW